MTNYPSTPLIESGPKKYAFVLRYQEEHDERTKSSRVIIDLNDVTANTSLRFTTLEPALDRIRETIFQLNSFGNPTGCQD